MFTIESLLKLQEYFASLPGIGAKTAQRLTYHVIEMPEEEVKENFARVLETVQQTAKKRAALLQGQTHSALVEDVNDQDPELLTGRLSNNMIVHFKGEKDLIGQIVPVCLKECHGFYYLGERV